MAKKDNKVGIKNSIPPGATLKETIRALKMTQSQLAERTGRPIKTISEIVNGKTAITADTAIQFEKVLGVPASFWLKLEANYQEVQARETARDQMIANVGWMKSFPIKAMISKGFLPKATDEVAQLDELLRFYGVVSPEAWAVKYSNVQLAFRKSEKFFCAIESLSAWLRQGEIKASKLMCKPFNKSAFRSMLKQIKRFSTEPLSLCLPKIQTLFADAGVAFVLVPELPNCPVSGVTQWVSKDKAILQMSLRYKSDDQFWFTLFHEAGHILLHEKSIFIEISEDSPDGKEKEANQFARDFLIPPEVYNNWLSSLKGNIPPDSFIQYFANELGVAPGIIVGRLQYDGVIGYNRGREFIKSINWDVVTI